MKESIVYNKAYRFAIRIVKAYQYLTTNKREYILSKQLLKSGTSIEANLAEANGAISVSDFSSKVSIAYKEALETKFWISLLKDTDYLEIPIYKSLFADADEISKMLFSILKKTRINSVNSYQ